MVRSMDADVSKRNDYSSRLELRKRCTILSDLEKEVAITEDLASTGKILKGMWDSSFPGDSGLSHELCLREVTGTAFVQGSPCDCGTVIHSTPFCTGGWRGAMYEITLQEQWSCKQQVLQLLWRSIPSVERVQHCIYYCFQRTALVWILHTHLIPVHFVCDNDTSWWWWWW